MVSYLGGNVVHIYVIYILHYAVWHAQSEKSAHTVYVHIIRIISYIIAFWKRHNNPLLGFFFLNTFTYYYFNTSLKYNVHVYNSVENPGAVKLLSRNYLRQVSAFLSFLFIFYPVVTTSVLYRIYSERLKNLVSFYVYWDTYYNNSYDMRIPRHTV